MWTSPGVSEIDSQRTRFGENVRRFQDSRSVSSSTPRNGWTGAPGGPRWIVSPLDHAELQQLSSTASNQRFCTLAGNRSLPHHLQRRDIQPRPRRPFKQFVLSGQRGELNGLIPDSRHKVSQSDLGPGPCAQIPLVCCQITSAQILFNSISSAPATREAQYTAVIKRDRNRVIGSRNSVVVKRDGQRIVSFD